MRSLINSKFFKTFFLPVGFLSGTIIGAGIFALPAVFTRGGVFVGLSYLVFTSIAYVIVFLLYGDVILRTTGKHRFVGYARKYLGDIAGALSVFMTIFEMIFVMTIYLVLSISFSNLIAPSLDPLIPLFIFWVLGSATIFLSLRRMVFLELLVVVGMIAIVVFIFFLGFGNFIEELFSGAHIPRFSGNILSLLIPLSPILFAFGGRVAIPSLIGYFNRPKTKENVYFIKRAIVGGTVLPAVVYVLFVFAVMGLSSSVSDDSVTGLIGVVAPSLLFVIGALGLLSLWSSYIIVGLDVERSLFYDLNFSSLIRIATIVFAPMALYFFGLQNFLSLVGIAGGVFLALEGLFIIAIWVRMQKKLKGSPLLISKYSYTGIVFASIIFATAFIYELSKLS
ncbi:MAG: hypothetical protein COU07_03860 [Candidatus Harrisonbacteria bacterium CG10_big_fil_rev_8_21_14_0_10_40_38]|uniref:Amino acid transporter transmembrane domain-containing protein n=1 Tax=Candidatus Harrisonbacteria bacterium CG10_big_fil_rev_8_21_14_0_10_40_38 TaxID=1974583 RepID=A0A2H0URG0_9BACT|nr:MAG: hypothetical protein COU07_03860 [Candidatus Harrisonbacteria bacterium CG10_big_fil_rev_8_21_14_0_10_40_38]